MAPTYFVGSRDQPLHRSSWIVTFPLRAHGSVFARTSLHSLKTSFPRRRFGARLYYRCAHGHSEKPEKAAAPGGARPPRRARRDLAHRGVARHGRGSRIAGDRARRDRLRLLADPLRGRRAAADVCAARTRRAALPAGHPRQDDYRLSRTGARRAAGRHGLRHARPRRRGRGPRPVADAGAARRLRPTRPSHRLRRRPLRPRHRAAHRGGPPGRGLSASPSIARRCRWCRTSGTT